MFRTDDRSPARQCGVALFAALVLLGLLSALAVSALQSSALELSMSASEQFRARAFEAAEAGQALALQALQNAAAGTTPAPWPDTAMPGMAGDRMRNSIRLIGADPLLAWRSGGALSGLHYTISSRGDSLRGARVEVEAGVLLIRNASGALIEVRTTWWRRSDLD